MRTHGESEPAGDGVEAERELSGKVGELARAKIVVVDDSKTIRRTAVMLLEREGAEVATAADGFEALSVIADNRPDVVFVDVMMPRLDGYQTCALVKANAAFRATPIIMLSSKDGLFDIAKGRMVGSEEYITKPFTRDELIAAAKRHLREHRRTDNC